MKVSQSIYLDYNATTPVDQAVLDEMLPWFTEKFGNASSNQHTYGWEAEEAVDIARERVAGLINARPTEITFTSGATESINLALKGYFEANRSKGNHIITVKTEHKAVLDCCKSLEESGASVTYLNVDSNGLIDLGSLKATITDQTLLVAIMHANNETGVIQPIKEIAEIAHESGVMVFSDITQSMGKIEVDVKNLGVDMVAFSSHKLYGPKGVGGLFINSASSVEIRPQIIGGGHEKGIRSGTHNVPGIVGFGKACEVAMKKYEDNAQRLQLLRDRMEKELSVLGEVRVNGQGAERLTHVLNISFRDVDGNKLIRSLKGLAVSQGSACNSAVIEPSHVLKAMGLSDTMALASLRISMGRFTTDEQIKKATSVIRGAIDQLRMQLL